MSGQRLALLCARHCILVGARNVINIAAEPRQPASAYKVKVLQMEDQGVDEHINSSEAALREPKQVPHLFKQGSVCQKKCFVTSLSAQVRLKRGRVGFTTFLPDIVFIEADRPDHQGKRILVVVDAKASRKVALSHKIQAAFCTRFSSTWW